MLDPIGGFNRIREFWLSYLDTAFRIRDASLASARQVLLREPGTLATDLFLEVVPRYRQSQYLLEDVRSLSEASNPLRGFSYEARRAFAELALSGLFPGEDTDDPEMLRRSRRGVRPYTHQWNMLERGAHPGTPGIVTSGTGSGKTESFMLPLLAALSAEAIHWPKPRRPLSPERWFDDGSDFRLRRANEHPDRPRAVRAILLYPMNALVEDQMARLRRTFDSPEAHRVMDSRFHGNRIFFGRYTGDTPVTGHLEHPRLYDDDGEKRSLERRKEKLAARMADMWKGQALARDHDQRAQERVEQARQRGEVVGDHDETRYMFPALDGGELVSRWDMQSTPPDVLVTNMSMLATMLVREVESPIWDATRDWLERDDDAYFYLILDELHLIRGSAGSEVVGLLRSLVARLGLHRDGMRHKLRVLGSSASLPIGEEAGAEDTATYLRQFFASFGTSSGKGDAGSADRWAGAVVPGDQEIAVASARLPLAASPFVAVVHKFADGPDRFVASIDRRSNELDEAIQAVAETLAIQTSGRDTADIAVDVVGEVAALLAYACRDSATGRPRATAADVVAESLFGHSPDRRIALQGLCILRGLSDRIGLKAMYEKVAASTLPSVRIHAFFRSTDGLFGTVRREDGNYLYESPTVERGMTHAKGKDGLLRRFVELVYCEACGELFVGGRRSPDGAASSEILTTAPNLEELPERTSDTLYEDMAHVDYAVFWPSTREPRAVGKLEQWRPRVLDTRNSVLLASGDGPWSVPGQVFAAPPGHERKAGSALPKCCPSCGTDYGKRKPGMGVASPLRSFRIGFAKASQLLATELFSLLHVTGSAAKSIVFSDSRQDAARAALDIERRHHQDMRRQLLVSEIRNVSLARGEQLARLDEMQAEVDRLWASGKRKQAMDLQDRVDQLKAAGDGSRVPLSDLLEPRSPRDTELKALMRRHVELGVHPIDPAGIDVVCGKPWHSWIDGRGGTPRWRSIDVNDTAGVARAAMADEQRPLTYEVLFSKTYFALEETGVGYPSLTASQEPDSDQLDALLRVIGDSYAVEGNRYRDPAPISSPREFPGRVKRFAEATGEDVDRRLSGWLDRLGQLGHMDGIVRLDGLHVHLVDEHAPWWRCDACGRVHLHRGFGICTRCHEQLPQSPNGKTAALRRGNFLARRLTRIGQNGDAVMTVAV
ncbi:DEAD/DEAH box helicase [Roseateles saccharophilus]|uniref:RAD3-like DEAD/DEAH box helicase n=1 Tax=Roseateles saccharophilus TaxID=304 RepID=A0A4R3UZ20_ROSSA|nr:DEAD/DEAH box helicase [Roseateles saccharophilus]MDG0836041.1 DEAD/DEAH box helicase [Roseateles saccharophilus]TCU96123.1 RAD3-like DEAD/DEAH box helicase [Roseateles saccharophilus]